MLTPSHRTSCDASSCGMLRSAPDPSYYAEVQTGGGSEQPTYEVTGPGGGAPGGMLYDATQQGGGELNYAAIDHGAFGFAV